MPHTQMATANIIWSLTCQTQGRKRMHTWSHMAVPAWCFSVSPTMARVHFSMYVFLEGAYPFYNRWGYWVFSDKNPKQHQAITEIIRSHLKTYMTVSEPLKTVARSGPRRQTISTCGWERRVLRVLAWSRPEQPYWKNGLLRVHGKSRNFR